MKVKKNNFQFAVNSVIFVMIISDDIRMKEDCCIN